MGSSAENAPFLRRERVPVLWGVDELVALVRRQPTHAADRLIDDLAAIGWQLFELLKKLARLLLLIRSQVLPGFHAVEHALLLLRRQTGKMLQPVLQPGLLLRWKPPELGIVFEHAALLRRWQVLITAQPVSGVAGLVLRTCRIGVRTIILLKVVPLPIRTLRLRSCVRGLGERESQQQKRRQTARN